MRQKTPPQKMAFAAALTLAVLLCITGILSYFHSEDAVSNRMTAISGSVMLAEPEWDSRGQFESRRCACCIRSGRKGA